MTNAKSGKLVLDPKTGKYVFELPKPKAAELNPDGTPKARVPAENTYVLLDKAMVEKIVKGIGVTGLNPAQARSAANQWASAQIAEAIAKFKK